MKLTSFPLFVALASAALILPVASTAPVPQRFATQRRVAATQVPEGLAASDWSSIREQYEQHRRAVFAVEGGYRARNPGQHWQTRFDGRGFITRPEAGGWEWGLELRSYGFPGHELAVASDAKSGHVVTAGARIAYDWDATLQEWFVNDVRGLEHGFTLHDRPAGAAGRLRLKLAVRGDLRPEVQSDGLGVRFVDNLGTAAITYAELTVRDADGRSFPARFEPVADGLQLTVEERDARYPLTIDPIAQQAYLKPSNTPLTTQLQGDPEFGCAVAVSGNTVVVGALHEASNATGVNGDQSDTSAQLAGAAYVFVRNGTTWSQQAYLKASNTEANDRFGFTVAVSGDTIVIGAELEASGARGIDGDGSDNSAPDAGAAYIFARNGTTWSQQAYLKAFNTDAYDNFGYFVAVSDDPVAGDTVVVGAPFECSSAMGIDGDESDNSASRAGAAYVFVRNGTTWSQQAYLKASNTGLNDNFGLSVSVSANTVVVGACGEKSSARGIDGDESDNSALDAGAAYVFVRNGTTWSQQAYLKASNTDPEDFFGFSVAVSGGTVVVGAYHEASHATGVGGDQLDNSAPGAGAAYVFVRNGTTWSQQAYLKASNTDGAASGFFGDYFGQSVAVSGDTVVIGAYQEASQATGVDGDQGDNSVVGAGAAYVFVRSGTGWSQQAYLKASNTAGDDLFGYSVSVSGNTIVVGAMGEDSNATGVDGDEGNNLTQAAGAAYIFNRAATATPEPVNVVYANGVFRFDITNAYDPGFSVVATTNFTTALSNWTVLDPPVAMGPGSYRFTDTTATNNPRRFYRLRRP